MLSWMAWTWPTAIFFVALFAALFVLTVIEIVDPGGAERKGVFGLTTTRGTRLFLSLLGTGYILCAWLGLVDGYVYIAFILGAVWGVFCFCKV